MSVARNQRRRHKKEQRKLSPVEQRAVELTDDLANKGMLIEGGFAAYIKVNGLIDAPIADLARLQDVYMHGAEHLWSSIMAILDPGSEETPADIRRMDLIQQEIDKWRKKKMDAHAQNYKTQGNA